MPSPPSPSLNPAGLSPVPAPLQRPLEVASLLESSQPQASKIPGTVLLIGLALSIALITGPATQSQSAALLINAGLVVVAVVLVWSLGAAARRHRGEQLLLSRVHEHIQPRRWPAAGEDIGALLSRPMLLVPSRYQALIYLAAVLGRYQRFGDALQVIEVVVGEGRLDPASELGMQAARVLALLREDRLVDADQALTQLKRRSPRRTATLAMMELYRDVKTGHHQDALDLFARDLPLLRDEAGHRHADAWALAAAASKALGKAEDAGRMAKNALLLADGREIVARFPETTAVLQAAGEGRAA